MKKAGIILCMVMALVFMFAMTGCGSSEEASEAGSAVSGELKTMADVFALEVDDETMAVLEDEAVYIYTIDKSITRVEADITEDIYKEADEIPFDDEDRDEKIKDILGPVKITNIDDLSDTMPSDDEVSALEGKTGQELMDDGFDFQYYTSDSGEVTVTAAKNYGAYMLTFEGSIKDDDEEWLDKIADMKVTSASYQGVDYSAVDSFEAE